MRTLATIVERIIGLVLVVALVVAPVVPALADCTPSESGVAMAKAAPCDVPCKDCASKSLKKSCQGECVCVKTMFLLAPDMPTLSGVAFLAPPHRFIPPRAVARPPDTPPPRSILV